MTVADKGMNSIYFGSDPADVRIWINPKYRSIRIPDHVWLRQPKFNGSGALGVDGGMNSLSVLWFDSYLARIQQVYQRRCEKLPLGHRMPNCISQNSRRQSVPAVSAATCQVLSTGSPVDDGHRLASYDTSLVVFFFSYACH